MAEQNKVNSPPIEKLLYRPKEAAQVIGASPSWVYARIEDGSLPAVRLAGRMVRIRRADLLKFIETPEVASA